MYIEDYLLSTEIHKKIQSKKSFTISVLEKDYYCSVVNSSDKNKIYVKYAPKYDDPTITELAFIVSSKYVVMP